MSEIAVEKVVPKKKPRQLEFSQRFSKYKLPSTQDHFRKYLGFGILDYPESLHPKMRFLWTTKKVGTYEFSASNFAACCGAHSATLNFSENYKPTYLEKFLKACIEYHHNKGFIFLMVNSTLAKEQAEVIERVCGKPSGESSTQTFYQCVIPYSPDLIIR